MTYHDDLRIQLFRLAHRSKGLRYAFNICRSTTNDNLFKVLKNLRTQFPDSKMWW